MISVRLSRQDSPVLFRPRHPITRQHCRAVHRTLEFVALKEKLYVNIRQVFFTSAAFFPMLAQGKAAIRITWRVEMEMTLIRLFCELISELLRTHDRDIGS